MALENEGVKKFSFMFLASQWVEMTIKKGGLNEIGFAIRSQTVLFCRKGLGYRGEVPCSIFVLQVVFHFSWKNKNLEIEYFGQQLEYFKWRKV